MRFNYLKFTKYIITGFFCELIIEIWEGEGKINTQLKQVSFPSLFNLLSNVLDPSRFEKILDQVDTISPK